VIDKPVLAAKTNPDCARSEPPTEARFRQLYERPTSFTNLLPWLEYDPGTRSFLLDDGFSVAALFELRPVPAESRPETYLAEIRDKLQTAIADAIPEETPPWVLQFYCQDEPDLEPLADRIEAYVNPRARETELTQGWMTQLRAHLKDVARPGGLFMDEKVTGGLWRGRIRKVRATLYRRRPSDRQIAHGRYDAPPEAELEDVTEKLQTAFLTAGIRVRRVTGQGLYEWMFRWFNPNPPETEGDTGALLKLSPYPGDEEMPFGHDFGETLVLGMPNSDAKTGTWGFDGKPHKAITVQKLRRIPAVGLFGAERVRGEHVYALFDRLPEHTVMAMTITIQSQDDVTNHLSQIKSASVGDNPEAKLAAIDAEKAMMEVAKGNKLFPVQTVFFLRGEDLNDLRRKVNDLNSLLLANSMQTIRERDDLLPLDAYARNLPMRYEYAFDRQRSRRSRLTFAKHTANLAPLYGRSTGTGNPGFLFFNRGAEPLTFDPLNRADRKKNGHGLIIGPTGAGKSATLVYFIMHMLAVYRPRIFIIEAGNSFGLLGQYLKSQGVTVNQVALQPKADVSLPPFSEALKLLDKKQLNLELSSARDLDDDPYNDYDEEIDDENDSNRDLLGEMEIAARIMITGGDPREDNRMNRADRLLIRRAILQAAKNVKASGREQVITIDVVSAMRDLDKLTERRRERAKDMADGMELFCSGLAGHFFNRPGVRWPNVDVTLVDMGILARDGYEDQLTVAYIGLMNHIHDLVERHQNTSRPTLVITDEGHIITTNPLLAPYVIKIVKMWRKFGAWFWIATQNLEDFPDASRKMLSMLEWWLCLVMPKDEVEQIARFKNLTAEERALLLAAKKQPGLYAEGVVLSDEMTALFRNVPPPLALALAMTEKDEKAKRRELMKQHGCSELEAVHHMAETIARQREAKL